MRCTGLDKTGSAYHTIVADGEGAQEERAGGTSEGRDRGNALYRSARPWFERHMVGQRLCRSLSRTAGANSGPTPSCLREPTAHSPCFYILFHNYCVHKGGGKAKNKEGGKESYNATAGLIVLQKITLRSSPGLRAGASPRGLRNSPGLWATPHPAVSGGDPRRHIGRQSLIPSLTDHTDPTPLPGPH